MQTQYVGGTIYGASVCVSVCTNHGKKKISTKQTQLQKSDRFVK